MGAFDVSFGDGGIARFPSATAGGGGIARDLVQLADGSLLVAGAREVLAMMPARRAARCMTAVIALAAAFAFTAAEGNHYILPCGDNCDIVGLNRWKAIGPDGASVVALAVDPGTPSIAFAGTVGAGVLKSTDGGAKWAGANHGLPTLSVFALAIDPANPSTLYAGTDAGVFTSTNGGQDWAAANSGLDGPSPVTINALAIDPQSPGTLYAGTPAGIFKTTNGGASWALLNNGPPGEPWFITIDPVSPATLYVGVYEANVFKSTDAGTSWTQIRSPYYESDYWPAVLALAIDPHTPSRLYLATEIGLVTSLDGGANWSSNLLPGCDIMLALAFDRPCWTPMALPGRTIASLAIDPASSATVYAGTGDGAVFRTTDGGDQWTAASDGPLAAGAYVNVIAATASPPATLYAGGPVGVFRSSDDAKTWAHPTLGVRNIGVGRVVVDPTAASTIYTTAQGVMKTSDGGDHWADSSVGISYLNINSLVIDPTSPSTLYAASSPVFKSTDAGAHWVPTSYGLDPLYYAGTMAIAPSRPSTLYIGVDFKGVLKTTDGGLSWTSVNNGFTAVGHYVSALAVDPTTADTVYVASPPTGQPATAAKIFKSTDGAAHWRQVPIVLPANSSITTLVIDPVTPSTIYGAYADYGAPDRGGVYKSSDGGETWIAMRSDLPAAWVTRLTIDPSRPSRVYAATRAGVFWSPDGAMTWLPLNDGLTTPDVWDLAIDPAGSVLRAATNAGLYEYRLSGPAHGPVAVACRATSASKPSSRAESSSTPGAPALRYRRSATSPGCREGSSWR